ncbi:unnamed protein product [Rotaria magnacalcarata]|uniref:Uncharacterized protein n=1 Tax=Rotaria magnacalcarata TaxID=392030 RepID=A0A814K9Z1_9BILA|nr:unnamed protein product [Rotaria magnacalcarata]CAF1640117.1 unnamed protein product [Rotaria magnacalcarata]CAF2128867.1 unnamed protein product [Rotaria magnacalcarata]CAF3938980.1 unnamed protein product [Rotaria magnacalcarata]CAF3991047.1 unnamed protein product [Rotaria magnacalcarata]
MYNHQQLFIIYLYVVLSFFVHLSVSRHPGHLKPFGSSGPFGQIDELTDTFPDPIAFFDQYVSKLRPVIFRQAIKNDPHLSLWNKDDNLKEIFLNNNEIVHIETRKKESRQQDILSMTMAEFLKRYQNEELYLVEEVPNLLRPYFTLPTCLQCKPALETFQVAMFWFSSGNTSSVVHTDDYDNINCVLQGDKQFILVDPYIFKEVASEIIDNYSGSYSSMDVDQVDYNKYRSLNNDTLYYYQVNLSKGDCLFIPYVWIHQVRSKNRNIAVNYWLNHERVEKAIVDNNTCQLTSKSDFVRLDTLQWPKQETSNIEYLRNFMLDLVDEEFRTFKEWTREFSKDLNFDLRSDAETITLFAEFFNAIDVNENGFVTTNEIDYIFDNDRITEAYEILQDILDIVDRKLEKNKRTTNTSSIDNSDEDDMFSDDHSINGTFSGGETGEEDSEHDEL